LGYLFLKRAVDILGSLFGLAVSSPFLIMLLIIIPLESKGAPIYKHRRLGLNKKEFSVYKFRSMRNGSITDFLSEAQLDQYFCEFKVDNDPRVTRIGAFIRKTSIDELPQLFNILVGHMSFIGPRPVVELELEKYGNRAADFLSVKPGLSGYWQAYARNNVGYEDGKRQKMELYYINNRSMWLDAKIFCKTILSVLRRTGAK
jgi:lipopolysaccharide/colanic/teichoic acid biosynthesis glycosyltransferase